MPGIVRPIWRLIANLQVIQLLRLHLELLPKSLRYTLSSRRREFTCLERQMLRSLRDDGIVVLPEFLSLEQVDIMRGAINQAIEDNKFYVSAGKFAFNEPNLDPEKIERMNVIDPTMLSIEFIRLGLQPSIRRVVDEYLGINSMLAGIAAYRTKPTLSPPSGAFNWHYDNTYLQVKAIAYLTDVSEEDGPFSYIPNTRRRRSLNARYEETRFSDEDFPAGSFVNCVGKAGTVIIVDTQIIHRATPNLRGSRDVVSIIYDAATSARRRCFYNLPISTPDLLGLTAEQRHFLRVPEVPGQVG